MIKADSGQTAHLFDSSYKHFSKGKVSETVYIWLIPGWRSETVVITLWSHTGDILLVRKQQGTEIKKTMQQRMIETDS